MEANGLTDRVKILAGKVEELPGLPAPKVDVIVSEWMGYALLFETMLDTVLHARDRWLNPGGAVLPDIAKIFVALGSEEATELDFWNKVRSRGRARRFLSGSWDQRALRPLQVYGFSMAPFRRHAHERALRRPVVSKVPAGAILGPSQELRSLDLTTMRPEDADFNADFRLSVRGDADVEVHSVVLWFDCLFSERFCRDKAVVLSTSPHATQTHWAQVRTAGASDTVARQRTGDTTSLTDSSADGVCPEGPCGSFLRGAAGGPPQLQQKQGQAPDPRDVARVLEADGGGSPWAIPDHDLHHGRRGVKSAPFQQQIYAKWLTTRSRQVLCSSIPSGTRCPLG